MVRHAALLTLVMATGCASVGGGRLAKTALPPSPASVSRTADGEGLTLYLRTLRDLIERDAVLDVRREVVRKFDNEVLTDLVRFPDRNAIGARRQDAGQVERMHDF